jgi:hypothetical protein
MWATIIRIGFCLLAVTSNLLAGMAEGANRPGYAIVTSSAIRSASAQLDDFVLHKEGRGFDVYVFDEADWGGAGLAGDAAAEALRTFLGTAELALGFEYLLIIGDPRPATGPVPMKLLYPRNTGAVGTTPVGGSVICDFAQTSVPSDYYYAELDGNWDLDGDGKFGEFGDSSAIGSPSGDFGIGGVEREHELFVGRIPVYSSPSAPSVFEQGMLDLDHILAKTIAYQSAPPASISWRLSALIATEGANRFFYGESIRDDFLLGEGFSPIYRVYDSAACTQAGSCNPSLSDPPDSDICSVPEVEAGWTAETPGIVTWLTHGGGIGAQAVMNSSTTGVLDDEFPAITFQAFCLNSQPSATNNLSYSLLINGAIATVGATVISHGPGSPVDLSSAAHLSGNAGMGYAFTRKVAVDRQSVGQALMAIKRDHTLYGRCWYWQNFTGFNLYGDPEVSLYSTAAQNVPLTTPFFVAFLASLLVAMGGYQLLPKGRRAGSTPRPGTRRRTRWLK